jgi:hypothetical protein
MRLPLPARLLPWQAYDAKMKSEAKFMPLMKLYLLRLGRSA